MNKKVLIFNGLIAMISLFLLLRGIYLINNASIIASELAYKFQVQNPQWSNWWNDSQTTLTHFLETVKLKGFVFFVFSLFGFLISSINLNKEISIKE